MNPTVSSFKAIILLGGAALGFLGIAIFAIGHEALYAFISAAFTGVMAHAGIVESIKSVIMPVVSYDPQQGPPPNDPRMA